MHLTTINEKIGHEFEKGRVYERAWKEEREERNGVIIISKSKIKRVSS